MIIASILFAMIVGSALIELPFFAHVGKLAELSVECS
jgi:hypothetical protein